jgi:hypothetical protein
VNRELESYSLFIIFLAFGKKNPMCSHHDVRQTEMHTAELLVPDPSPCEVEIATAKLKRFKSPGSDQIPAELIQAGGEI